ncbi:MULTISPECIES: hypothetical protein [unclassified Bradyrhizobium]|uniref:hypothetical protein n=1 Tax=unclassified Bradyrhizobium TaxID=2631580 RepID=UPI0028F076AE|nr:MULTISPECIES: hypothetical protein [unclassified Bradyrhizobium]
MQLLPFGLPLKTPDTLTQRRVLGDKLGGNEPQFRINSVSILSCPSAAFFPQEDLHRAAILAALSRQIGHIDEDGPGFSPSGIKGVTPTTSAFVDK